MTRYAGSVDIVLHDGARIRWFVAPSAQWITLAAGRIARAQRQPKRNRIVLTLDAASTTKPVARLTIEAPGGGRVFAPYGGALERDAWTLSLGKAPATVVPKMGCAYPLPS